MHRLSKQPTRSVPSRRWRETSLRLCPTPHRAPAATDWAATGRREEVQTNDGMTIASIRQQIKRSKALALLPFASTGLADSSMTEVYGALSKALDVGVPHLAWRNCMTSRLTHVADLPCAAHRSSVADMVQKYQLGGGAVQYDSPGRSCCMYVVIWAAAEAPLANLPL